MTEDGKIKIDKFDDHDFGFWKMQIEDYLYQKKLHEPLAEAKPTSMKAEDWTLLDRQALCVVRLSLVKNIAYNIVNEKTAYGLLKALSNMYEKPNHVNEFNSILSRLMSVDIKFDDEVQALLLLSSLPESWSGTVITVSGSTGTTNLKFYNIRDLILGEDIHRKTFGEYSNSLLSAEDKGRGKKKDRGRKQNKGISKSKKRGGYMAVRDYDDTVCCIENTVEDRIMDSGALFHATFCKEELERFRLRSGKVRLADDKTLDIAGVKDVVLKTSFGTSWTLKDVRYIPGLKGRLISFGQLDKEGYHVGFGDQQWKVTKSSLLVAHRNKCGSLYMVEVPSDGINATIDGKGNATLWHQRLGHMSEKGMKILTSKGRIPYLQKDVEDPATMLPLSMTAAERFRIPEEEWQGKEVILAHLKAMAQIRWDIAFGIRRVTRSSEVEMSGVDIKEMDKNQSKKRTKPNTRRKECTRARNYQAMVNNGQLTK
ncbi:hypothetical protein Tco_1158410 [Tanacetum coccineum]